MLLILYKKHGPIECILFYCKISFNKISGIEPRIYIVLYRNKSIHQTVVVNLFRFEGTNALNRLLKITFTSCLMRYLMDFESVHNAPKALFLPRYELLNLLLLFPKK